MSAEKLLLLGEYEWIYHACADRALLIALEAIEQLLPGTEGEKAK